MSSQCTMRLCSRWLLQHGVRELPLTTASFDRRYALITPLKFDVDARGIRHDRPTTVFCGALGISWSVPLVTELQELFAAHNAPFVRFQYRKVTPWSIEAWIEDITTLIDRFRALTDQPVNLIATSAGAQAALRAAMTRPNCISSLVLIAPGVGIGVDMVERAIPGALQALRNGQSVQWPDEKGRPYTEMTYREMIAYKSNCPVNRTALKTIDLTHTRVAILHGIDDRLVPYQCSVQLAQKLRCADVELRLVPTMPHVLLKMTPTLKQLIETHLIQHDAVEQQPLYKTSRDSSNLLHAIH